MKCNAVKNVMGNLAIAVHFHNVKSDLNSARKSMPINKPVIHIIDIITLPTFMTCTHFLLVIFVQP